MKKKPTDQLIEMPEHFNLLIQSMRNQINNIVLINVEDRDGVEYWVEKDTSDTTFTAELKSMRVTCKDGYYEGYLRFASGEIILFHFPPSTEPPLYG